MKNRVLYAICALLCVLVCVTMSISEDSINSNYNPDNNASNNTITPNALHSYINTVKSKNINIADTKLSNIKATITFSESMSSEALQDYINSYNINAVQLQARGYDKDGKRITFFSKTSLGIDSTYQTLINMAKENNVDFAGVIGMYAYVDTEQIIDIQQNKKTLLLDTSSYKQASDEQKESLLQLQNNNTSEYAEQAFVNNIAWDAEDLGLVSYEILN